MDAIVCVKQIPDPETPLAAFRLNEELMTVDEVPGIQPVISPFDAQAVEAALQLRDVSGSDGIVNILSLGPDSARDAIKHGLATGSFYMCSGCRKPVSLKDKKSKKYEEGVSCPNCYDYLKASQKERFRMRQKQINLSFWEAFK